MNNRDFAVRSRGSTTAPVFRAGYLVDIPGAKISTLDEKVFNAVKAGLQLIIHVIGDRVASADILATNPDEIKKANSNDDY